MKKLLLISICLITFIGFGQSRTNAVIPEFDSLGAKLETATGWKYNSESGQWIDNPNYIDYKKGNTFWISHTYQNFNWIRFGQITINNSNYMVLLFEKKSGYYEYPNIQEDWNETKETHFVVFTEDQYTDIKSIIEKKEGVDKLVQSPLYGFMTDKYELLGGEHEYNDKNLCMKINNKIKDGGSKYLKSTLLLNSQNIDNQDIVRFKLPSHRVSDPNTEKSYFEVSFSIFSKIFF